MKINGLTIVTEKPDLDLLPEYPFLEYARVFKKSDIPEGGPRIAAHIEGKLLQEFNEGKLPVKELKAFQRIQFNGSYTKDKLSKASIKVLHELDMPVIFELGESNCRLIMDAKMNDINAMPVFNCRKDGTLPPVIGYSTIGYRITSLDSLKKTTNHNSVWVEIKTDDFSILEEFSKLIK